MLQRFQSHPPGADWRAAATLPLHRRAFFRWDFRLRREFSLAPHDTALIRFTFEVFNLTNAGNLQHAPRGTKRHPGRPQLHAVGPDPGSHLGSVRSEAGFLVPSPATAAWGGDFLVADPGAWFTEDD